jgi:CBS domain-containing protein
MSLSNPLRPSVRLTVHRRYLVDGASRVVEKGFVHCPVESDFVDSAECSRCGHCAARIETASHGACIECVPPTIPRGHAAGNGSASPGAGAMATRAIALSERSVLCVRPELSLSHAQNHALRRNARFVVAIDAAIRPLGVLSLDDLQRPLQATGAVTARRVVSDVMRPLRLCLPADVSVSLATAALAQSSAEEAVLIASEGEVLALLRTIDLLRWYAREDGYVVGEGLDAFARPL